MSEMVQNSPRFTVLETKPIFPLKTMPDANEVSHGDADIQNRKLRKHKHRETRKHIKDFSFVYNFCNYTVILSVKY